MNNTHNANAPSGPPGGGYGANRYGAPSGYGGDRYGTSGGPSGGPPQRGGSGGGGGGYGGLGGNNYGGEDDNDRSALFGGAQDRVQQRQQQAGGYNNAAPPPYDADGQSNNDAASSQGYGTTGYQERQLTAEEEEEEDVKATKQQLRFLKQSDVASTRNALRIAAQAEETGRDTLARLGAQGEHIHATEKALDLSQNQIRTAEDKTRELKKLNKSMFAMHVGNPLTSAQRRRDRDEAIIERHLDERTEREATRRGAYLADQRMQKNFKEVGAEGPAGGRKGRNLAERAKYQFEADSEDEQMEDEIDGNLDALSGAAGRLNALARATGQEVDQQNALLGRITEKVSHLAKVVATCLNTDLSAERSRRHSSCQRACEIRSHSLITATPWALSCSIMFMSIEPGGFKHCENDTSSKLA